VPATRGLVAAAVILGACVWIQAADSVRPAAGLDARAVITQAENLRPEVLELALGAFERASREGLVRRKVLTIVDYELPSYEKRLWVIDLERCRVLHEEWVAHGMGRPRGTGGTLEAARSFSNSPGTLKSSLGLYVTAETYFGRHGYSLKLDGLEPGINDAARERLIVLHGADYVTSDRADAHELGRSWGCPAVRPEVARGLIDAIKGGSLLWIYYPERSWLEASRYLVDE
jgi:hypothetical protein